MSLDRAEGPENSQACQIMGNSEQAWQKFYDLKFSMRESQVGVDSTAAWRDAMLERGGQSVSSDGMIAPEGHEMDSVE